MLPSEQRSVASSTSAPLDLSRSSFNSPSAMLKTEQKSSALRKGIHSFKPYECHQKRRLSLLGVNSPNSGSLSSRETDMSTKSLRAKEWIRRNLRKQKGSFIAFWSIVLAYSQFCAQMNEVPVYSNTLYGLIRQQFQNDLDFDDEKSENKKVFQNLALVKNVESLRNEEDDGFDSLRSESMQTVALEQSNGDSNHQFGSEDAQATRKTETSGSAKKLCEDSDDSGLGSENPQSETDLSSEEDTRSPKVLRRSLSTQARTSLLDGCGSPSEATPLVRSETFPNYSKLSRWPSLDEVQNRKDVIIDKMSSILSFRDFAHSPCLKEASQIRFLLLEMFKKNTVKLFLDVYAHSQSCKGCPNKLCSMFRRVLITHVLKQKLATRTGQSSKVHHCALKDIYEHILLLHLDHCAGGGCGIPNCAILQEKRKLAKRSGSKSD